MSPAVPSVLLVEDHAVLGRIIVRFLRQQGKVEVWALVKSAETALARLAAPLAGARRPDLALVDVSLPGMSGIDLVAELLRLYPSLPAVMLSAHRDPSYVRQALGNGACGYVVKGDPRAIVDAVHCVLAGNTYVSGSLRKVLRF